MIRYFFFALVLLMAICPAPARATELPKHIAPEELDTDNTSVWDKATSFDDCANRGGVKLWRQGNQAGYVIGRFNPRMPRSTCFHVTGAAIEIPRARAMNRHLVSDSVSVLSAARVGPLQRSEYRHYSIARKFAAMRARIANERSNEL
jgi:hypothetical protein